MVIVSHASAIASSWAPSGIVGGPEVRRVAAAVPALVVVADPRALLLVEHAGGHAGADAGVLADVLELRAGQRARAREQAFGERGLADVVQARGVMEARLGVRAPAARLGQRDGQRGDAAAVLVAVSTAREICDGGAGAPHSAASRPNAFAQ